MSELARLSSEIYDLLDRATLLLRDRLSHVRIPTHVHSDDQLEERYRRVALAMLSFACYSAASTMRVLVRSDVTLQLPTLLRQQFESAVTAVYIEIINPKKAQDFILLDAFERLDLSREADLSAERRASIEAECRETLQEYPDLLRRLKNGQEILAGKLPIDAKVFKAVRDKLDFPDVRSMVEALQKTEAGFSGSLYTIGFRFGSLTGHPNIIALRRLFDGWDGTGSPALNLDLGEPGAPDFVLQGLSFVIGLGHMLDNANGAAAEQRNDWTEVETEHVALIARLHALDNERRAIPPTKLPNDHVNP